MSPNGMSPNAMSPNAMSPNAPMSDDDRRDLISRQHRALYGSESNMYSPDSMARSSYLPDSRGPTSNPPGLRGSSPYDSFSLVHNAGAPPVEPIGPRETSQQSRSREGSTSSPASNNPNSSGFMQDYSGTPASTRTNTSSPGNADSPSTLGRNKSAPTSAPGTVAPIGTRPMNVNGSGTQTSPSPGVVHGVSQGSLQKPRATTPLPSPLSHAYTATNDTQSQGDGSPPNPDDVYGKSGQGGNQRSSSTKPWGNAGGAWGGKGMQAKVW
jgi:hypothetical protein